MKPIILQIDTLDDRREWFTLLRKLPVRDRIDFLFWCCQQTHSDTQKPLPNLSVMRGRSLAALRGDEAADVALANEIRLDCAMLVTQYGLDPKAASEELERRVRLWGRA